MFTPVQNTPINHPDHPKLLESLRQLGNLALKMNECKRRKELSKEGARAGCGWTYSIQWAI
jgi:hypothetical protein